MDEKARNRGDEGKRTARHAAQTRHMCCEAEDTENTDFSTAWSGDLSATIGVPWRAWCGNLSTLMEHRAELVKVDLVMEHHEKSELWEIVTPAEFCWTHPWICGESVFSE